MTGMRWLALLSAMCTALGACSNSTGSGASTDGGAATAGSAGASGGSGTGGSAGAGGSAGTGGSAGAGGSAGLGGSAGSGGASPTCDWQGFCSDPTLGCDLRTGQCTAYTCSGDCATGQYCDLQSGTCKPDPCVGVTCQPTELCDPDQGKCIPLCSWGCPQGQFCNYNTGFCMAGSADATLCGTKPSGATSPACSTPIWDRIAPTPYDGQRGADVISGDLVLWADSKTSGTVGPATGVSQNLTGDFDVTVDFADFFAPNFDDNGAYWPAQLVVRLVNDAVVGDAGFAATSTMYGGSADDNTYNSYVSCRAWGGFDSTNIVKSPDELVGQGVSGSVHIKRAGASYEVSFDCDGHTQSISATWFDGPVRLEITLDLGHVLGPCTSPNFVRIPDVSFAAGGGTSDTFDCDSLKP